MLYDRPYMRFQESLSVERVSAVKTLLVATISIFVVEQIISISFLGAGGAENTFIKDWFALSASNFKEFKIWTVVSYAFLHSSYTIWHIIGNMLGLFFIGRIIEPLLGKRSFLRLYFSGAVIGGLAYLLFHLNDLSSVVGASAAVTALLGFFCMQFPERRVTLLLFFFIPLNVKPKWIFWTFLWVSTYLLLFSESQGMNGVAHSAHLGGLLTGVVYHRYIYSRRSDSGSIFSRPSIEVPKWFKKRKKTESRISYQVNRPTKKRDVLQKEIDRILDKINTSGFSSLSNTEKATLDKAKEILNN